ncbi:hypothetical protein GCM10010449_43810 [Streptomyces rectiviolaceus]|uniref:Uncharacterized protein n=1 Tax=Streptomyces rectiviolaceus TaxID=332591 RepID=A0ABP6MKV1_9ACTN
MLGLPRGSLPKPVDDRRNRDGTHHQQSGEDDHGGCDSVGGDQSEQGPDRDRHAGKQMDQQPNRQ